MQEFFAWPFVVVFMLPTCTVGPTLDLLYCMGPKQFICHYIGRRSGPRGETCFTDTPCTGNNYQGSRLFGAEIWTLMKH